MSDHIYKTADLPGAERSSSCVRVGRRSKGNMKLMRPSASALSMALNSSPCGASSASRACASASDAPCKSADSFGPWAQDGLGILRHSFA